MILPHLCRHARRPSRKKAESLAVPADRLTVFDLSAVEMITGHSAMTMKPGFTFRKIRPDPAEISDWRTCIPISAAQLLGFGQIISLGNKYFLSAGHHDCFLLGRDRKEPLTFEKVSLLVHF